MLHKMLLEINQAYREWRFARDVDRFMPIPKAIGRYSHDKMGNPGKRRAARWAGCRT